MTVTAKEIAGTKGLFAAGEKVRIVKKFASGNYLIESTLDTKKRVYAEPEELIISTTK